MPRKPTHLRIIGGEHRGRILDFTAAEGLRPTPDRVRETLFNWLQPVIEGARCLDLFAGSGALGLEAASRGAAGVVMLESHLRSTNQIQSHIETLRLTDAEVVCQKAEDYLQQAGRGFDIVFIDPPYESDLLVKVCAMLEDNHWLKPGSRIYVESGSVISAGDLPDNWQITHSKQAGQVFYHLAIRR